MKQELYRSIEKTWGTDKIEPGDVVQISPDYSTWGGCVVVVDKIDGNEIEAILPVGPSCNFNVSVPPEECYRVGTVKWMPRLYEDN